MFQELTTPRFLLQQIQPEDQGFVFEGLSHPEVIPFYGVSYASFDATKAQMEFYDSLLRDGTGCWWKIVEQQTSERLGAIGFNNYTEVHSKAEIGYWLLPQFWKRGIISEVLPVVITYMQAEKKIHRIEALIEEGNEGSCHVMQKAGFVLEGKLRDYEWKNGNYISLLMFSLLASDERTVRS